MDGCSLFAWYIDPLPYRHWHWSHEIPVLLRAPSAPLVLSSLAAFRSGGAGLVWSRECDLYCRIRSGSGDQVTERLRRRGDPFQHLCAGVGADARHCRGHACGFPVLMEDCSRCSISAGPIFSGLLCCCPRPRCGPLPTYSGFSQVAPVHCLQDLVWRLSRVARGNWWISSGVCSTGAAFP